MTNGYAPNATGGGFMNNHQEESPAGKKKSNQSLRSVTIKQILDASEGDELLGGGGQVAIVGLVRAKLAQSTNLTFTLDDGTGSIQVKQWLNNSDGDAGHSEDNVRELSYCYAVGVLRAFNKSVNFNATIVRPLNNDFNRLTCHLLECIATTLSGSSQHLLKHSLASSSDYQQQSSSSLHYYINEMPPIQSRILDYAKRFGRGPEGVAIALLKKQVVADGFPDYAVDEAIVDLFTNGHLYNTSDEFTCKTVS